MDFFVKFFVKVRTQLNFPGRSKELNQSTKNVMEIIHQQSLIVQAYLLYTVCTKDKKRYKKVQNYSFINFKAFYLFVYDLFYY